jgi:hypothetical protein
LGAFLSVDALVVGHDEGVLALAGLIFLHGFNETVKEPSNFSRGLKHGRGFSRSDETQSACDLKLRVELTLRP